MDEQLLTGEHILITGGAGYIGSALASSLAKGNNVTVFDNFASSVRTAKELIDKGIDVITGDLTNLNDVSRALTGSYTYIFHLAAAHLRISLSNPQLVHDVNVTGTLNLLWAARGQKLKRFIHVSSSEAYGTATTPVMKETHTAKPTTVYGMSKYMGELYTLLFYRQYHIPAVVLRPFNCYGPQAHFDGMYGEVIPRFVLRALSGKQPLIFGDGNQTRDFTYLDDTVRGIILAGATSAPIEGEAINIAYGKGVSIKTVAKIICKEVGIPFHPTYLPPRPLDVKHHAADITKAKKLLRYVPQVPIEEGIRRYVQWVTSRYPDVTSLVAHLPDLNW